MKVVDSDPKQPEIRPHQHNYKPTPDPEQDTVIASKTCSGEGEGALPSSPAPKPPQRSDKSMVHGIAPDEVVRLAPKLKLYLARPSPTWPELVDAADWLRHDLGVSQPLWGDACLAMGRELAAVALAIVSTKDPGISGRRRAAISMGWSSKPRPANCISSARYGRFAAPRRRNPRGEGDLTHATTAGRTEAGRRDGSTG